MIECNGDLFYAMPKQRAAGWGHRMVDRGSVFLLAQGSRPQALRSVLYRNRPEPRRQRMGIRAHCVEELVRLRALASVLGEGERPRPPPDLALRQRAAIQFDRRRRAASVRLKRYRITCLGLLDGY